MTPAGDAHLGAVLSGLVDGELTAHEVATAGTHLAGCATCAAELARTSEARELLRRLPSVEPPVPLWLARVDPRSRRWVARGAAVAAAVSVAVLASLNAAQPAPEQVSRLVQAHTLSGVDADPVGQMAPAAIPVSFEP